MIWRKPPVFGMVQYRYVANFWYLCIRGSGQMKVLPSWLLGLVIAPWGCWLKYWLKWMNITPSNYRSIVEREILFLIISLCENYMKVCGLLYTLFHNYLISLVGICPLIHILASMSLCDCIIFLLCSNALARNLHVDQNSANLQTMRGSLNLTTCLCTENALVRESICTLW